MQIITMGTHKRYDEVGGTYQTERDGQPLWAAFIQVSRLPDGSHLIIEAFAPLEVQAAETCMQKAKILGSMMTYAIQESFWAPLRRAEAQARSKAFGAILSKAKDDDDDDDGGMAS